MKKLLVIVLGLFLTVGFAQEKTKLNVPKVVKEKFSTTFAGATNVKWEKEDGNYEVNFKDGSVSKSAAYDKKGNIQELEIVLKTSELPESITKTIANDYKGYTVTAANNAEAKGVKTFEVDVKKGKIHKELIFDANGKFVKENKEND